MPVILPELLPAPNIPPPKDPTSAHMNASHTKNFHFKERVQYHLRSLERGPPRQANIVRCERDKERLGMSLDQRCRLYSQSLAARHNKAKLQP